MEPIILWFLFMYFPARLIQLRKTLDLTQQGLAEIAQLHVNQIRRYEAGTAQPTLEALIRLAKALHVSLDSLVFTKDERGPGDDMALLFEAIKEFSEEEKETVRTVLAGLVLQHSARRLDSTRTARTTAKSSTTKTQAGK